MILRGQQCDYNNIIDFANMVFKTINFPNLHPRLYRNHPEISSYHYLIKEDDTIKGMACSIPMKLKVGNASLNVRGLGTVSVHPNSRGKGYMKSLIKLIHEDAQKENVDFFCLNGLRQRYEHFGYEVGDTKISYIVTPTNRKYKSEICTDDIQFLPLLSHSEYFDMCYNLYNSEEYRFEREKSAFIETIRQGQIVLKNNQFLGYFTLTENAVIHEFILNDYTKTTETVMAMVEYFEKPVEFLVGFEQSEVVEVLNDFAENTSIVSAEMIKILNFPHTIEVLLSEKSRHHQLANGELILEVKDDCRFKITVQNNNITVQNTDETPDISLIDYQMINKLFLQSSIPLYKTEMEKSWFPLTLHLNTLDMV